MSAGGPSRLIRDYLPGGASRRVPVQPRRAGRRSIGFVGLTAATVVLSSIACTQPAPASTGAHIVERSRLAMGSELRITAWTADETAALSAFEAVVRRLRSTRRADERLARGQRRPAAERRGRRAAGAGERRGPRGPARRPSGQRLDGREVRRDVWRALGPVEVRPRSGQPHSRSAGSPQAAAAHRLRRGGRGRTRRAPRFSRRKGMRVHLGGIGKGYAVDRARRHAPAARPAATS